MYQCHHKYRCKSNNIHNHSHNNNNNHNMLCGNMLPQ